MKSARDVNDGILAAFRAGDIKALFSLYSTNVVIREAPGLPFGGDYVGHDGLRAFFAAMAESFDIVPTILDVFEISDSLLITYTKLQMTARGTGEVVEMPVLELLTVRYEVVVEAVPFYWDTKELAAMVQRAKAHSSSLE